jgi:hypothetical protein
MAASVNLCASNSTMPESSVTNKPSTNGTPALRASATQSDSAHHIRTKNEHICLLPLLAVLCAIACFLWHACTAWDSKAAWVA